MGGAAVLTEQKATKQKAARNAKRTAAKPHTRARVHTENVAEAELPLFVPAPSRVSSKSRISSKGQITLPMQVRERLGVGSGDQVEFFFDGERTVVKPVRPEGNPFEKWIGIAKDRVPADFDPIAWQREIRGWDAWDEEHYK
ncbi:MAG TPA: AbrB/MazE/SpoVT family DNA-binding domain-containing protein [Acidobacteriaceae bacterium]